MNNLGSWRAFLRHVKMHKFVFGLGGPLHPRPNLLFSKMTLLFYFIMKTLHYGRLTHKVPLKYVQPPRRKVKKT